MMIEWIWVFDDGVKIVVFVGFVVDLFLTFQTLMDDGVAFFGWFANSDWFHQRMAVALAVARIGFVEVERKKTFSAVVAAWFRARRVEMAAI